MPRQPMTDEQKKAFGEKMKAARLAKAHPNLTPNGVDQLQKTGEMPTQNGDQLNPPQGNGTLPQPASAQEEPTLASKMAELDAAIRKTNELNAQIEAQEKIRTEAFNSGKTISVEEQKSVIQSHTSKIALIKERLKLQPKVRIFIPLEGKEKPGTQLPVTIQGYRVNVPKGVYVDVPEQIATIVTDSLNQTAAAIDNPLRLDLDEKKADILA